LGGAAEDAHVERRDELRAGGREGRGNRGKERGEGEDHADHRHVTHRPTGALTGQSVASDISGKITGCPTIPRRPPKARTSPISSGSTSSATWPRASTPSATGAADRGPRRRTPGRRSIP